MLGPLSASRNSPSHGKGCGGQRTLPVGTRTAFLEAGTRAGSRRQSRSQPEGSDPLDRRRSSAGRDRSLYGTANASLEAGTGSGRPAEA